MSHALAIVLMCMTLNVTIFFLVRLSVDNITEEVKALKSKLKELKKAMKGGPKDIAKQFSEFVEVLLLFLL